MSSKADIARAFGAAADRYDQAATVQRLAAGRLADRIAALPLPPRARILEIGCGTGFLTRALAARLPDADWIVSDISPAMVQLGRAVIPGVQAAVADGERPPFADGSFDLVCSSLAFQWFDDVESALGRLAALLRPGGHLAFCTLLDGAFAEWREAHAALGLEADPGRATPAARLAGLRIGAAALRLERETLVEAHADARAFLKSLRAIGAHSPAPGRRPLSPAKLKAVMARFEAQGAVCTYALGHGVLTRPSDRGVFVTGTGTGVGKTLVSAVLAKAWGADYWKPLQTGLAEEAGDSPTVAALAGVRVHPPAYALQAPLSPDAAARREGVTIDFAGLALPETSRGLVVEGAGGALVPLDDAWDMTDLMVRLGLPTVVVSHSGLGAINHTLLTLEALKARSIPILGVVLSGESFADNHQAIARRGGVPVIAELPQLDAVTSAAVADLAARIPALDALLGGCDHAAAPK